MYARFVLWLSWTMRSVCNIAFHYFHSLFNYLSIMWPIHVQVISHMCAVKMTGASEEFHLGNFYLYIRSLFHLLVHSLKPLYVSQWTKVSSECLLRCEQDVKELRKQ